MSLSANRTAPPRSPYPKSVYQRNAQIYKLLANPKRLEILNTLKQRSCTVEQLARVSGSRMANISQHLAVLRAARLVRVRRAGTSAHYSLSDPRLVEPCRILRDLHRVRGWRV